MTLNINELSSIIMLMLTKFNATIVLYSIRIQPNTKDRLFGTALVISETTNTLQ